MTDTMETQEADVEDVSPSLGCALGISLISDRIFHYLSISDVLQSSLVSVMWRKISRSYLRRRKRLEITFEISSSAQLSKLDDLLMNCNPSNLPFAGSKVSAQLYILHQKPYFGINRLYPCRDPDVLCFSGQNNDVVALYPHIFQKLPVKNLRIDFKRDCQFEDCACEDVLKKLIALRARSTTEYLEIFCWEKKVQGLWKYLNIPKHSHESTALHQSNLFQSLRSINMRNFISDVLQFQELICNIIASSPVLENVYGLVSNLVLPISDGTYSVNHYGVQLPWSKLPTIIRDVIANSRHSIGFLLESKPNLEHLVLDPRIIFPNEGETENEVKESVQKSLSTIIENCSKSLTTLMCNDLTYFLPCAINCTLSHCVVLKLLISHPYYHFEDDILFLKAINFSTYLPNLRCFELQFKTQCSQKLARKKIESRSALYRRATFTCLSVNKLILTYYGVDFPGEIPSWSDIPDLFPNVRSLHLKCRYRQSPELARGLGQLWHENLEVLEFCFYEHIGGKSLWILLTELLENLCDISMEELMSVNCNDFNQWSYAPTRCVLFNHKRCSRIVVTLKSHWCYFNESGYLALDRDRPYKTRFDLISTWTRAKIPELSLTLKFMPCVDRLCRPDVCNPFPFYTGMIRKEKTGGNGLESIYETWHLNF